MTEVAIATNDSEKTFHEIFCPMLEGFLREEKIGRTGLFLGILNLYYALLGFLLNLWFVITFLRHSSVRIRQNIVLFGLSISDLLGALCVQALFGVKLIFESSGNYQHSCWITATRNASLLMFIMATILILSLMSTERYLAVFKEDFYSRHVSKRLLTVIIILIWMIVTTAGSILLAKHMTSNTAVVLGYGSLVALTTIWNIFAYTKIFCVLKAKSRITLALEIRLHGQKLSYKQARRSYKCLAILSIFIISYMPYLLLMFVSRLNKLVVNVNAFHATFTIGCLSSRVNPCLYFISSSSLRSTMMKTLPLRKTKVDTTKVN